VSTCSRSKFGAASLAGGGFCNELARQVTSIIRGLKGLSPAAGLLIARFRHRLSLLNGPRATAMRSRRLVAA